MTTCLRPPRGVTRDEVAKHFLCVLATFCEQKTRYVHADEGQPPKTLSAICLVCSAQTFFPCEGARVVSLPRPCPLLLALEYISLGRRRATKHTRRLRGPTSLKQLSAVCHLLAHITFVCISFSREQGFI